MDFRIIMIPLAIALVALTVGAFAWDAYITRKTEREAGCYGETKEEDTQM